jgi:hypothetical protein
VRNASLVLTAVIAAMLVGCESTSWRRQFNKQLPVMGHRNFIVVADSAYPQQSNPGIETIFTGQGQLETVIEVLAAIEAAPHVRPVVYVDAELASVAEADAPGIGEYRKSLDKALAGMDVQRLGHEDIIRKLDASAELFNVLILKTDMVLPYTSVFIELDCGYWNPQAEQRLRKALGG